MSFLDNTPRWIKDATLPFYEVWYLKFNPGSKDWSLWLRFTLLRRKKTGEEIAELWAIFTDNRTGTPKKQGFKSTFPISQFKTENETIHISTGRLRNEGTSGSITNPNGNIEWKIHFENRTKAFSHVPTLFEKLKLNKATVFTPFPNLIANGSFSVNGESFSMTNSRGMQGHIFGKKNGLRWAWGHCNLTDNGSDFVFEGITAHIQLGGVITSPPISAFLIEWKGRRFEFNSTKDALTTKSTPSLERWDVILKRGSLVFQITITSQLNDFAGVPYEDTDGSALYCHNSKVSEFHVDVFENDKMVDQIHSTRACAYEWVTRKRDPRIEFVL